MLFGQSEYDQIIPCCHKYDEICSSRSEEKRCARETAAGTSIADQDTCIRGRPWTDQRTPK